MGNTASNQKVDKPLRQANKDQYSAVSNIHKNNITNSVNATLIVYREMLLV